MSTERFLSIFMAYSSLREIIYSLDSFDGIIVWFHYPKKKTQTKFNLQF